MGVQRELHKDTGSAFKDPVKMVFFGEGYQFLAEVIGEGVNHEFSKMVDELTKKRTNEHFVVLFLLQFFLQHPAAGLIFTKLVRVLYQI